MKPLYEFSLIEKILLDSQDIDVSADWVWSVALDTGVQDLRDLRALSLGLIAELICEELMVAGVSEQSGFVPWVMTPQESIVNIIDRWMSWGLESPTPGAICWLMNTDKGNQIADQAFQREKLRESDLDQRQDDK